MKRPRRPGAAGCAAAALVLFCRLAALPAAAQLGAALPPPLPLFPPDNWWNIDISARAGRPGERRLHQLHRPRTPAAPRLRRRRHRRPADGIYGFPYVVVPGTQPLVPVTFVLYADESDDGAPGRPPGYPDPGRGADASRSGSRAATPGGGDRRRLPHADRRPRQPHPLRALPGALERRPLGGRLGRDLPARLATPAGPTAGPAPTPPASPSCPAWCATTRSSAPTPSATPSASPCATATATSSPPRTTPARDPAAPPMGARLRLKAGKDLSGYPPDVQRIFQAMKTYGLIVADNGSDMYVQGTYDTRWNNDVLNPAFAQPQGERLRGRPARLARARRRARPCAARRHPALPRRHALRRRGVEWTTAADGTSGSGHAVAADRRHRLLLVLRPRQRRDCWSRSSTAAPSTATSGSSPPA